MPQETASAMSVAKWFVDRANSEYIDVGGVAEGLTNLKLQKLLYFAQAVSLSMNDKPIFDDKIEAWQFGPVVPSVYHKLKVYENKPVKIEEEVADLPDEVKRMLEDVWNLYGKFSAHELVNITHNHLPWKKVYQSGVADIEITKDEIKKYYTDYYHLT